MIEHKYNAWLMIARKNTKILYCTLYQQLNSQAPTGHNSIPVTYRDALIASLRCIYKFTASYGSVGRFRWDSAIKILHSSYTSRSHGMVWRKTHWLLHSWTSSFSTGERKSLVP